MIAQAGFGGDSPRTRVLAMAQIGFGLSEWDELRDLGEAATSRHSDGDTFAAQTERWRAVETFVNSYSGGVLVMDVLEFLCKEHGVWCGQVVRQVRQDANDGTLTRSQQRCFKARYKRLLEGHHAAEEWLQWMVQQVRDRRELLVVYLRTGRTRAN